MPSDEPAHQTAGLPKLLFLCKADPYRTVGGASIRNRQTLRLLASRFEIHLACLNWGHESGVLASNVHAVRVSRIPLLGLWRWRALSLSRFYSRPMVRLVEALASEHAFSVVYVSELAMATYVVRATWPSNPFVVLDSHNIEADVLRQALPYYSLPMRAFLAHEERVVRRFEREALNRAHVRVFVSGDDHDLAEAAYGRFEQSVVIPNCYLPSPAPELGGRATSASIQRFAIVGTLDWHANRIALRWFLRHIWDRYVSEHPDSELHLVGRKYRPGRLSGHRVFCTYNVEDVADSLRRIDACVAPLLYGGGTRLRVQEYFHYFKPVIATPRAVAGLGLTAGVHYLEFDDYRGFCSAVAKAQDLAFRSRLAETAADLLRSQFDIWSYKTRLMNALQAGLASQPLRTTP